jgi:hypothetical protein
MEFTPGTDIGQQILAMLLKIDATLTRVTGGNRYEPEKTGIEPDTGTCTGAKPPSGLVSRCF